MKLRTTSLPALALVALALLAGEAAGADGAAIAEGCANCHGRNGVSTEPQVPIIAGYSTKYIVDSLKNFKSKARFCAEVKIPAGPKKGTRSDMCRITAELPEGDWETIAKYFAAQKFVRAKQPFDAAKAQKGTAVYKLRCEKCHEDNGSSPDEDNGILAGQWMPYLRDQIAGFRAGRRPIDDKMKQRLDKVNKEDEEALLHFFASQQ
jgi:sulfide dehydrogenase cytochrome subunit